ncbi:hypothetical protein ACSLVK_21745 [Photorhabdus tasmaniensis]|uniref:hypothetical protein n=1 Tax=Photorhabdus tasmaniensis TaxID=1004159 RepID=UPI004042DCE3
MTYKKYNPSVEGYMGDFLRGNVGINQLKPQHEFFDAVGLEKALSDNTQYHIVLTLSEAKSIIEDINPFRSPNPYDGEAFARGIEEENKKKNPMSYVFSVTDPVSTYAGSIYDLHEFYEVCREFKRLNMTSTIYVGENGNRYIHLSGHPSLRRLVRETRYGANHPKMLAMGIGQPGLNSSIVKGVKFCIIFSIGYRVIESIFKDEYTLADFIGNITMDMAKTAIIAVAGIVLVTGILVAYGLDILDKKYGISEKLIAFLKEEMKRKPRTPEAELQYFFNGLGRLR